MDFPGTKNGERSDRCAVPGSGFPRIGNDICNRLLFEHHRNAEFTGTGVVHQNERVALREAAACRRTPLQGRAADQVRF